MEKTDKCKSDLIECLRCGKCCYSPKGKKCHFLRYLKDGTTKCMKYNDRIGTALDKNCACNLREKSIYNYEGCPYNALHPEKEIK